MPMQLFAFLLASPALLIVYSLACMLVGWYGKDTRVGYWGFLILSFVLTPLVTVIILYFSAPKKHK